MERNFTRSRLAVRRTPGAFQRPRWLLSGILALVILVLAVCIYIYFYKSHAIQSLAANSYVARFSVWLEERKTKLQTAKTKSDQPYLVSEETKSPSSIHFEFYNALPNMQVATVDPIPKTVMPKNVPVKEVEKKEVRVPITQTASKTQKIEIAQAKKVLPKSKIKQTPFGLVVSAEELERELSDQLKQKKYIIQLGMFRDGNAAKRYRKVLSRSGFTVNVVKVKEGRQAAYRIQQGPFLDMHRAKLAQKSLQKKGIASLVVRMNQG